jgi:hypothetical protein
MSNENVLTVNHWGKWVTSDVPVTGVMSCNNIAWENVTNEECLDCREEYKKFEDGSHTCEYGEDCNCADFIECDSSHSKLIGDAWQLDTNTGLWDVKQDKTGLEFAAIIRESVVQVVWSVKTKRGALCSPCYPGQVDLDSNGDFLGYTLPDYMVGSED